MCALKNDGKGGKKVKAGKSGKAKYERLRGGGVPDKEAQQRSENQWACAFDAISDWVIVMDIKGRVLRSNRAGETFTGLRNEEMIGQNCCTLVHGSKKHIPGCPLQRMLKSGQRESVELKVPGENRWLMVTVDPVTDEQGNLVRAVHVVRDITDRRQDQEALRASEERFRGIVQSIGDLIWDVDERCVFTYCSEGTARLFGYPPEEVIGKTPFDFMTPAEAERVKAIVGRLFERKEPIRNFENYYVHRDGTVHCIITNGVPVLDDAGNVTGYRGVCKDVTERKRAENALRTSEEKYRSFVENFPGIAYRGDVDFNAEFLHGSVEQMTGYAEEEFSTGAIKWDKLVHPDDLPRVLEGRDRQVAQRLRSYEAEYRVVARDGTLRWVHQKYQSLLDDSGQVIGSEGVIYDVTARRKAAEDLEREHNLLRTVIDNIPDRIYVKDTESRFVLCNKAVAGHEGQISPADLVGKTDFDFYPPQLAESYFAEEQKVMQTAEPLLNREGTVRNSADGQRCVLTTKVPLRDSRGNVTGLVGINHDITERKRVEEALRQSEEKYRSFVEHFQGIAYRGRIDFTALFFHGSVEEITGYKESDFLAGSPGWDEVIHPEDRAGVFTEDEKKLHTVPGYSCDREYRIVRKDGQVRWVHEYIQNVPDSGGGPVMVQGTIRDITERKRAEEELRESGERYRSTLDNMLEGCQIIGYNWRYLYVNDAIAEQGRQPREKLLGRTMMEAYPDIEDTAMFALLRECMEKRIPHRVENEFVFPDGSKGCFELSIQPAPEGIFILSLDITERKQAEERLCQQKEILQTILDNAPIMTAFLDPDGTHRWVNRGWERMLGWSLAEARSRDTLAEFYPDPEYQRYVRNFIAKADGVWGDFKTRRRDGTVIDTCWANVRLSDGSNIGIGQDVTQRKRAEDALRDSEGKLSAMLGSIADTMSMMDRQLNIVWANDTAKKTFGDDIVGRKCYDVFHNRAEPCEPQPCLAMQAFADGRVHEHDTEVIDSDGNKRCFHCTASVALRDAGGEPVCIIEISRDITEQKCAEEALRESELRFRELFEHMSSGVAVYEPVDDGEDFILKDFNRAGQRIDSLTRADVIGKRVTEVFPGIRHFGLLDVFQRVWRMGEPEHHPVSLYKDERISGWRENYVYKLPSGEIVTVYDNVTERVKAREELAREHNLLRTLVDSIPDEIYVKDKDSRFVLANEAVARHRGVGSIEGLIGKTDFDLYSAERARPFYEEEQRIMRTGEALREERRDAVDENGARMVGLTTKMPLRDSKGQVVGIVGISHDITEEEQARQRLLKYQGQLKTLASQLSLAEERERRRIAGELHDQVSQSLALAKIKLDALRAGATAREPLDVLTEVSATLAEAIGQTRSLTFDLSYPILYELGFEAAVAEWLDEHVRKKHGLETVFEDDGQPKPLDDSTRVLFFRSIRELLINVVKHACANKVVVSIRRVDGFVEVQIEDDGVGFDRRQLDVMAVHRGGFGIFSIRERLEELEGSFEIDSAPSQGCRVTMRAPLNLGQEIEGGQK